MKVLHIIALVLGIIGGIMMLFIGTMMFDTGTQYERTAFLIGILGCVIIGVSVMGFVFIWGSEYL